MREIYIGTLCTAILVYLLATVALFIQRKKGERSRMILAAMTLLSVLNYMGALIYFYIDPTGGSGTVMDVPFLLRGIFVITLCLIYPIEVISPGWVTWRRLIKLHIPVISLWLFYRLTLLLGVEYTLYPTMGDMMLDRGSLQVIFRMVLAILIFLPTVLLYYVPYTRGYNNTNHAWMRGYVVAITINRAAYLWGNINDTFLSCSMYILIGVICSLYITYQELFVRLMRQTTDLLTPPKAKTAELFERLEKYMNDKKAWRDPDLSAEKIISALHSNRTLMLKVAKEHGYSGYSSYVNSKRIAEFIKIINRGEATNYQQTFLDVGFRSKTSALRNFKEMIGMTPSEYFKKKDKGE